MSAETWFVLEDGSVADPREVAPDAAGVLRHRGGVAVAMRGEVPHSRGVDAEAERAKASAAPSRQATSPNDRELKAERPAATPKRTYKTRESKAR